MKQYLLLSLIILLLLKGYSQPQFTRDYPDSLNKKRLITAAGIQGGSCVALLSFLSFIWYVDKERVPFHYYDDAAGYLQMDKLGHAFGAYRQSFAAYYGLRWAGLDKKKALLYGGPMGFIFQAPIEIFDGMYEGWGFSWSDIAANALGSIAFCVQEALFDNQFILMKFSYSPSIYPKYHKILGENYLEQFFLDYNAHTYWLSCNLRGLTKIKKIPQWLNIAFGHSVNGVIYEFKNPEYNSDGTPIHLERYRQFLFSLDIDFSRIPTNKKWLRTVFRAINLLKLPFPAIEYNRVEGIKFNPIYF